ncbi:hypothetical protein IFM89_037506 [Coptis chinensis]|uniref:AMP-binding enzyme C-terminal domain-containing protein n=1 Tax=Coptis chinensis TaxID=261450 RepID=A0A835IT27_9MAGN|nr:hypothetical protein IFM89_037506 [Coptis chinensis]
MKCGITIPRLDLALVVGSSMPNETLSAVGPSKGDGSNLAEKNQTERFEHEFGKLLPTLRRSREGSSEPSWNIRFIHPKIADVALIPYHVEEAGQIPMAFVVRKPGSNLSAAQVLEFVGKQACLVKTKRFILNAYLGFLLSPVGSKPDEGKIVGDPLSNLGKGGVFVLMVCVTCGKRGDRWTAQCPFKDLAQPLESFVDKPPASETIAPSYAHQRELMFLLVEGGADRVDMI